MSMLLRPKSIKLADAGSNPSGDDICPMYQLTFLVPWSDNGTLPRQRRPEERVVNNVGL